MKSRAHFQFRQFSVADDRCSMKVGTDAVLLAAWADLQNAKRILDIGTGSGVIALIAAQRSNDLCQIDGIEIQTEDCEQATANATASPWSERVNIIHRAVQDHHPPYRYDVILCNPPYFNNSLRPPTEGRSTARHTVTLDHVTLVESVERLLAENGSASFVMPPDEGGLFKIEMENRGMEIVRMCRFRTRAGKKIERVLMSFRRARPQDSTVQENTTRHPAEEELLLYASGDEWTDEYFALTRDLYIPRQRRS